MLRIGHFSKITGVAVKTLRYYDQIGLLNPAHIDPYSGYRYYALGQWRRLNRILALKDLGLSLDQIAIVLTDDLSAAELRGMLRLARVNLESTIKTMQAKMTRVEKRLKQIEVEDSMKALDIVIKSVEPVRVVGIRRSSSESFPPLFEQVYQKVQGLTAQQQLKATRPLMGIFYEDPTDADGNCDFEVALPTNSHLAVSTEVQTHTLPAVSEMATYVYYGSPSWDDNDAMYESILQWIEDHGYVVDGPYREIYHQTGAGASEAVTEIQFPIKQ
jgi:DNA-binding transcriptional MerR regulator